MTRFTSLAALAALTILGTTAAAQVRPAASKPAMKPEDTEIWKPVPKIITPGRTNADAPSDAIVLFDGTNENEWVSASDGSPARWTVTNGVMTVVKRAGDIRTKRSFTNYQLHIEWRVPENVTGKDQARGNSGVYLAWTKDYGYELQVLDSYQNETYVNGQAASIYKQYPPLVNASRPPGAWQSYDIIFHRPRFDAHGTLLQPARMTILHNGVLVQDNVVLTGPTAYQHRPPYKAHPDRLPIMLQDHSYRVRYRNIWIREL